MAEVILLLMFFLLEEVSRFCLRQGRKERGDVCSCVACECMQSWGLISRVEEQIKSESSLAPCDNCFCRSAAIKLVVCRMAVLQKIQNRNSPPPSDWRQWSVRVLLPDREPSRRDCQEVPIRQSSLSWGAPKQASRIVTKRVQNHRLGKNHDVRIVVARRYTCVVLPKNWDFSENCWVLKMIMVIFVLSFQILDKFCVPMKLCKRK